MVFESQDSTKVIKFCDLLAFSAVIYCLPFVLLRPVIGVGTKRVFGQNARVQFRNLASLLEQIANPSWHRRSRCDPSRRLRLLNHCWGDLRRERRILYWYVLSRDCTWLTCITF